jgi:hypothetical protein
MVVRAEQDASSCSIASRLSQRKRKRDQDVHDDEQTKQQQKQRNADILVIREKLGDYQHHGTGNPLSLRSPTTPKDQAVQNLDKIIKVGVLGLPSTNSTPHLKTERGSSSGSFWTTRIRLAGSYGWTGIILPSDADFSKPFPVVEKASWFLLENENEQTQLELSLLSESKDRWNSVRDRVVTISQLAERLRCS